MTELRWVLLALGILVILAVYCWGRGIPRRWLAPFTIATKRGGTKSDFLESEDDAGGSPEIDTVSPLDSPPDLDERADKIVTLRLIPYDKEIACDRAILALRAVGLNHGRYGVFHMQASDVVDEPMFSVANLTEPGSFDLSNLADTKIPGMSFFMVLPGAGDPVARFDAMVSTARELASELGGELRDEKGSSWSIQRERYIREEIIEYCHLIDKPLLRG